MNNSAFPPRSPSHETASRWYAATDVHPPRIITGLGVVRDQNLNSSSRTFRSSEVVARHHMPVKTGSALISIKFRNLQIPDSDGQSADAPDRYIRGPNT
jgi:hypothetical protein